jgi:hypothetical protein
LKIFFLKIILKKDKIKKKMENETVSRYYQKQYERFMKQTEKKDLKEALVKRDPDEDKSEEETMYTRLRTNPRRIRRI